MKKILFTMLSMVILTLTYGQATKADKLKIISAGKMKTAAHRTMIVLTGHAVLNVPNKLDIEADSILIDNKKSLLTAYGTKSFAFNGKIVVGSTNHQTCWYRLGEDTLRIGL